MPMDILTTVDIIEIMENYIEKVRPPENIRKQLDLSYRIEDQSVILTEIRPIWNNPSESAEYSYAKATFIKSKNVWKIFWLRANLKWYSYEPMPEVSTLKEFLEIIDEDDYHCFKG
ncbi:DUF3024 domain-containing protein [Larkinella punicea]|uniref:DUF3024 domain-containing protein n=2 Tax=Larkinella punicea TaxID=2315727 RepID=A0A368JUW3_9BACT|nr:DUF3024 domain-containing protein [Larkinella punicea]